VRSAAFGLSISLWLAAQPEATPSSDPGTLPANDALVGLWGGERDFGPEVRGELTIDGRTSEWRAEIGGYAVPVRHEVNDVTVTVPAGRGEFRGQVSANRHSLNGHWIQPRTVTNGVSYATPVHLEMSADSVWRGEVRPWNDRLSLYLVVQPLRTDGSQHAFIRDPERNSGMGRSFVVTRAADQVTLTDLRRSDDRIEGRYNRQTDTLDLNLPDSGTLKFTRRSRDTAIGFYPVTPEDHYVYRPPVRTDDGWVTAALQSEGIDPAPVAALVTRIRDTQTSSYTSPYIQGILIAHHGKLVLEEYFYGFDRKRTHDLRSAAKTITGTLVGIARDHGAPFTLESAVYRLFPEYGSLANSDPRKYKITVRDLLTMNSGLNCDDNNDDSLGNEDRMQSQSEQPDYYKFTLDLPMSGEPGDGIAVYCTAGINLLGGVVRNATHMSLTAFFERFFAEPLDIGTYQLNLAPTGDAYMGGGIYLRPRDALKLGQVYLAGGRWRGRQVVSRSWVESSLRRYSTFPASSYAPAHGYGFAWHLLEIRVGTERFHEYMAQGNGGQLIIVLPELDVAIFIGAGNYNNFPTWRAYYEQLVPDYIIPAVLHARAVPPHS